MVAKSQQASNRGVIKALVPDQTTLTTLEYHATAIKGSQPERQKNMTLVLNQGVNPKSISTKSTDIRLPHTGLIELIHFFTLLKNN